jgi:HEAT repeat protein
VRLAYNFAIVSLGDAAFLDAIALALGSSGTAERARDYVLELGPGIAPYLYPYLNDPDPEVRGAVCDLVARIGEADAIPRLTPLLADPNPKVADRANRAIERLRRSGGGAAPRP